MKTAAIASLAVAGSCLACTADPSAHQPMTTSDAGVSSSEHTAHALGSDSTNVDNSTPPLDGRDEPQFADAGASATVDRTFDLGADASDGKPRTSTHPFPTNPRNTAAEPNVDPPATSPGESAESAARAPYGTRNFACQPSKSPMFLDQTPLEMRISGNFTRVNNEPGRDDATSPGLLDPDGPGPLDAIPVEIRARGHLRFLACGYRPFKVVFEEKQTDNVFRKLGKSVKFTTHCGDRVDMEPVLKAPSLDEYYQRVRMEHAAYQVVDTLDTLSLKTRLVWVTYHDTETNTEERHLAFVREPEDEMAERCGMLEGDDVPDEPAAGINYRAELLLYLVNNFILQSDVKNKLLLRDPVSQETVLAPYDFDLVGIFRRDFFKLNGRSLAENNAIFADWLRRNQSPALFEEVELLLAHETSMRSILDEADLSAENQALFDEWFASFMTTLKAFHACIRGESAADADACHVSDDFPNTLADAPVVAPGVHKVWLEPPGDKDVVSVALEANQLYSLVTRTRAQLLEPDGQPLAIIPPVTYGAIDTTYSFQTTSAATYHVEFDHGSSLVCSDMWAKDINAQDHAWALYRDDHANQPSLATPLEPGVTTVGTWELDPAQDVFDEDWFKVDVTDSTTLTLRFEGDGAGAVDAVKLAAPSDVVGWVELYPPMPDSIDLGELFPESGTYLIRVLQSFGTGTYALELN